MLMVVGKIISIFDISIEVILNSDTVKITETKTTFKDKLNSVDGDKQQKIKIIRWKINV